MELEAQNLAGLNLTSNKHTQTTKIDSSYSKYSTINCGAPQGSVLGPLLLSIYVNDIYLSVPEVNCHLFADDNPQNKEALKTKKTSM